MISEYIEPEHPSYGKIQINSFNGGTDYLFGQRKTNSGAISIDFYQSDLKDSFGSITRLGIGRTLFKIDFTAEQWSELILNKNSETGTPVTIRFDEQGRVKYEESKHKDDTVFEKYSENVREKFKNVFASEKEVAYILTKDKISAADRKKVQEIFQITSQGLTKDKNFLEKELDAFLTNVENVSEERFVKGLKKNVLNIEDTKLIEGPEVITIENRYQGILVLKSITNAKGTLIKDHEADNGVSLTLYRAVVKRDSNNESIVKTDEKLIEVRMSNSQFSQFIISFGRGETPCTISNKMGEDIEPCRVNINDEVEDIHHLFQHIDTIEGKVEELGNEIEPLLSKTPSKERKRQILFVFEKLSRLVGVDFRHHAKKVFDSGLKYSIRRQEDVQSGIIDSVNKKGMEEIKNNPLKLGELEHKLLPESKK